MPRYTSYPTAPHFGPAVNAKTYDAWLEFRKTTDLNTTAYPGAIGWAYKHRRTEFTIKTPTNSAILDLESGAIATFVGMSEDEVEGARNWLAADVAYRLAVTRLEQL